MNPNREQKAKILRDLTSRDLHTLPFPAYDSSEFLISFLTTEGGTGKNPLWDQVVQ